MGWDTKHFVHWKLNSAGLGHPDPVYFPERLASLLGVDFPVPRTLRPIIVLCVPKALSQEAPVLSDYFCDLWRNSNFSWRAKVWEQDSSHTEATLSPWVSDTKTQISGPRGLRYLDTPCFNLTWHSLIFSPKYFLYFISALGYKYNLSNFPGYSWVLCFKSSFRRHQTRDSIFFCFAHSLLTNLCLGPLTCWGIASLF